MCTSTADCRRRRARRRRVAWATTIRPRGRASCAKQKRGLAAEAGHRSGGKCSRGSARRGPWAGRASTVGRLSGHVQWVATRVAVHCRPVLVARVLHSLDAHRVSPSGSMFGSCREMPLHGACINCEPVCCIRMPSHATHIYMWHRVGLTTIFSMQLYWLRRDPWCQSSVRRMIAVRVVLVLVYAGLTVVWLAGVAEA